MGVTGWLDAGEPQEPREPRAGGFAGFILANRAAPDQGRTLEQVLARAAQPDRPPEPYDDDDRQAALVTRGYRPGMVSQLALQLADVESELQGERERIERGERRAEHVRRMHANGQIRALDIPDALGDEGDPGRVGQLERRAQSLRSQIAAAQAAITPQQQRDLDPFEAASRAGHQVFREVTRARWAEAQSGTAARPAPRPFPGSVSRSGGTEHTGPDCWVCREGRRLDAARNSENAPYAPGGVTTEYAEIAR
jgi:hypothetical protein